MSLNNVQLPLQLLADLYRDSLVETHASDVPVSAGFRHLGNNGKQILVVTNNPDLAFLSDDDLNFLSSVLNACKLGLADIALLNINTINFTDYHELLQQFNSRIVLLTGVEPATFGLPLSFPHFQIQRFEEQTYLYTPALTEIAQNKTLKGQLWNSLKQIFGL